MKIIVPKHVEAWMFDMWVDLGPFRLKMRQMFLVALGVAITFWIAQSLMKKWIWKVPAFIIASPGLLIMLFIAFFRKSELAIIPFLLKIIRTYIIWTPRTFQKNTIRPAQREIKLHFAKLNKGEEKQVTKKDLHEEDLNKDLEIINKRS